MSNVVDPKVKPSKKKPIRKFFKFFVDVKKWSSYDEVSANVKTTCGMYRRLFKSDIGENHAETYEEAIARLGMDEAQIVARKKTLLRSAIVYWIFAFILFGYMIRLIINGCFYAAALDFILVVLATLLAYREHFWYMQMQRKKLGCKFSDWIAFILGRVG